MISPSVREQFDGFMLRAAELALKGLGHTRPNPAVGAVIARGGKIIGEGWHKKAGGDHAEVAAIKNAIRRGEKTFDGAVLFVTLEPCSRKGKVGACTDAIIESGIKEVYYALPDPNPVNRGRAKRVLAKRGVFCSRLKCSPETALRCENLIRGFAMMINRSRPFVTVKIAMSLDGRICDKNGDAKWISSPSARRQTGRFREVCDAIMVGAQTVRSDNPSLLSHGRPNPDLVRVVISKSGNLPKDAQVFTDGKNQTLVYDNPREALFDLGARGFQWVLCEGGMDLAVSLAEEGLVDEWVAVLAPKVIGSRNIGEAVKLERVICLQD